MKDLNKFISEASKTILNRKVGVVMRIIFGWRGKRYMIKMFFPTVVLPSRKEVQDQVTKVYPGAKIVNYKVSDYDSGEPILQTRG